MLVSNYKLDYNIIFQTCNLKNSKDAKRLTYLAPIDIVILYLAH